MFGFNQKDNSEIITALEKEKSDLNNHISELNKQIDSYKNDIENYSTNNNKKIIAQLKQEINNLKLNHAEEIKRIEISVNRKINSTLASIGVSNFVQENFIQPKKERDVTALLEEFSQITDPKLKSEFWMKHKEELTKSVLK